MSSVYEALPECGERRCKITRTEDILAFRYIFQHGDNPEAVTFVDAVSMAVDPATEVRRQLREWAERIHRYEEVVPTDTHLTETTR